VVVVQADPAVHVLGVPPGDGETQARATRFACPALLGANQRLEDSFPVFQRNAVSVIPNLNAEDIANLPRGHRNLRITTGSAGERSMESVFKEALHHLE
jgi:hypothetical protein